MYVYINKLSIKLCYVYIVWYITYINVFILIILYYNHMSELKEIKNIIGFIFKLYIYLLKVCHVLKHNSYVKSFEIHK